MHCLLVALFCAYLVNGSYIVEVNVHSYWNPSGRCAECQDGSEPGCCDETVVRPANETCPSSSACDTLIAYCAVPLGDPPCMPEMGDYSPNFRPNSSTTIDFDAEGTLLGLDQPLTVEQDEPWIGLQFILESRDCESDDEESCGSSRYIDQVFINMDDLVGTTSPEQPYTGNAGLVEFTVSYSVRCAVDHYGADCTRECTNFVSCDGCGLPGFFGEFCQFPADNCSEVYCNGNGECEDGSPTCDCEPGYTGDRCEVDINECEGVNCGHGMCEDEVNSYRCVCDAGYTGESCRANIRECEGVTCSDHGTCEDGIDSYTCVCNAGFTGTLCETDIDDCEGVDCTGNGRCENRVNRFMCFCDAGFTGDLCEENIDDCAGEVEKCSGNGRCEDGVNSFTCVCEPGYTGDLCEVDIDDCKGASCSGNGRCEDGVNSFVCMCEPGFTGERCEVNIDECEGVNCSSNGRCEDGANGFTCVCEPGFTGELCEQLIVTVATTPDSEPVVAIAAGVAGGVVVLILVATIVILVVIICVLLRRTRRAHESPSSNSVVGIEMTHVVMNNDAIKDGVVGGNEPLVASSDDEHA